MLKYIVLFLFVAIFALLIRRDRVYVIPMILIIYSNINGLLGWEDFALKGFIKFQDYGFLITVTMLFLSAFSLRKPEPEYLSALRNIPLLNAVNAYWLYYICLFVFSALIMGSIIWPIKMARVFFYGIIFYLIYKEMLLNPIITFEKIINCLLIATVIFGVLYITYNIFGLDIYPKGEQESFNLGYLVGDVKRNFSGFPMFTYYFIFLFTEKLMTGSGNKLLNLTGLSILLLCLLLMLTRGTLILTILMLGFLVAYRKLNKDILLRLFLLVILLLTGLILVPFLAEGHYLAMLRRFDEFSNYGLAGSANFVYRMQEFERIVGNVIDFDPFFGFGFTVVQAFGYSSGGLYHAGSADNGFSNLIGVTGFVGLTFFLVVIVCWILVNVKLQALKSESYSRVHFVFIIFMLGSFLNGSSMSYMHAYVLFLTYDLMAYAYLTHGQREIYKLRPSTKASVFA